MTEQNGHLEDEPLFVISVAAELAGMHPQTLRQYDRLGLVTPQRSRGRGRRYSHDDIHRLRTIQRLSQEDGINLAGIERIILLTDQVAKLEEEIANLHLQIRKSKLHPHRVFTADSQGQINARTPLRSSWSETVQVSTGKWEMTPEEVALATRWISQLPSPLAELVLGSVLGNQRGNRRQLVAAPVSKKRNL